MTQYRVGEAGATVFNERGEPLATLRPGYVVIEGRIKDTGTLADQYRQRHDEPKRRRGYANKMIQAGSYEDKSS